MINNPATSHTLSNNAVTVSSVYTGAISSGLVSVNAVTQTIPIGSSTVNLPEPSTGTQSLASGEELALFSLSFSLLNKFNSMQLQ